MREVTKETIAGWPEKAPGSICPIPKTGKTDWKADMDNKRPIPLLEIPRKNCLSTKCRLTQALDRHVLKGYNPADLPDNSTGEYPTL